MKLIIKVQDQLQEENLNITTLEDSQINLLAERIAVIYQSVFADKPWNEVAKDPNGNPLSLTQIQKDFEPFFPITETSLNIKDVLVSKGKESQVILSTTNQTSNINQIFEGIPTPQGEFPRTTESISLNGKELYISGFTWARRYSTLERLITKGAFTETQAIEYLEANQINPNCWYIEELGVINSERGYGIGRFLKTNLIETLADSKLPLLSNTKETSPAYNLNISVGGKVIAGPGLFDREGYVLFLNQTAC